MYYKIFRLTVKIIKLIRKFNFGRKLIKLIFKNFDVKISKNLEKKNTYIQNFINNGYLLFNDLETSNYFNNNKLSTAIESANKIISRKKDAYHKNITSKKYLINLLDFKNSKYTEIVSILEFILSDEVIDNVRGYLNVEPLLSEVKILYSPIYNSKNLQGSQLFHVDFDDEKIVKIFIYLDDIDDETGPLQIIDKTSTKKIFLENDMNFYEKHSDNFKDLDKYKTLTLTGAKKTINFVDTCNCLHRGSRNNKRERFILYANFSTRSSYRNTPIFTRSNDFNIIRHHSPMFELAKLLSKDKQVFLKRN